MNPLLHDPHPQSGDWPSERARLLDGIPREGTCWFCKRTVPYNDLIAGYDTWDEQRLACSRCDRNMKKGWPTPFRPLDMSGPDLYEPERRYHDRRKRDRRAVVAAIIAGLGLVFLAGAVAGRATATSRPSSGAAVFTAVTIPSEAPRAGDTNLTTGLTNVPGSSSGASLILDPAAPTEPATPPGDVAPDGELVVVTPRPVASAGITGIASYYDWHPGQAAACAPLRAALPDWRGRVVSVSGIAVRLTDYCPQTGRVIDLDDATFARLAPLSRGLVEVRVSW